MLYRYSGIDENGKNKRGFVDAINHIEALKLVKINESIIVVTSLKRQSENPLMKKPMELIQKQMEQISNKVEENKKDSKLKKIAKIKAKKEKLLNQQDAKLKKTVSKMNLSSLMKFELSSFSKKEKVEMDEDIYNEIFQIFKARAEKNKDLDEAKEDLANIERQSLEKPKLKKDNLNKEKKTNSKEKEIDWKLFETPELSSDVKKNMKLKVKPKEILLFTKRLQIMLASGMTLIKSLKTLAKNKNKTMKHIVLQVISDIEEGNPFSSALAKFPKQFDYTYVSLISIGESSGTLDAVLLDIIESFEKKAKVNKKIKTATIYPKIIGGVLVLVLMLGSIFFIPAFRTMFEEQDYALPILTQIVFAIADFLPFIIGGIIGLGILLKIVKEQNKTVAMFYKKHVDKIMLSIPFIKNLLITSYMYNFSFTVALMLKNGIRLNDALSLSEKTINNIYIKSEINDMVSLMIQGMSFSEAMSKQKHFDDILVNIVLTGEESGQLNFSLSQIAKYYNEELDKVIDTISELVQPVSILLVGLIVVPVVIAVYMPILEVSSGALLDL